MKVYAKGYLCDASDSHEKLKRELSAANEKAVVQAFRARSRNEAFFGMLAAQTLHAESSGTLLARKPEIDLLLRLAGTTQISAAIKGRGARGGEPFVLLVAGTSEPKGAKALGGKRLGRGKLTNVELGQVERAALLSARRS